MASDMGRHFVIELNTCSSYVVTDIAYHHGALSWHVTRAKTRGVMWPGSGDEEEESDDELPCEFAGHGKITTGSVSSCSPL
jgi:hypothetical protein